MRKLFARQLAKARSGSGEIDLMALGELVVGAYEEAERDRRRTDRSMGLMIEELGEVHQRLVDAIDVIPEGIALFDAEDRYVMWNRRYAETYSANADALAVGAKFEDVLRSGLAHTQDVDAVGREEEWIAERLARHRADSHTHEQHLAGGRWIRVEERRTSSGGSVGVRVDITDLKKREESFRLLFDGNPVPMWVVDSDNQNILAVNDAVVEHYGYSREQFLTMTTFDVRPAEDRAEFERYLRSGALSQGTRIWRHKVADGSCIHVSIYARSLNYQGRNARINAIVDVTAEKAAENELIKQKAVTETALNNMSQGLVLFDSSGRMAVCNRRYIEMYGLSPEVVRPGCSFRSLINHRKGVGTFVGDVDQYCTNVLASLGDGKSIETRVQLDDERSILIINQPMADGGWVATHEDITERERANARIAKEVNENRRLFESSMDLILVTDSLGRIVRVSPSAFRILEYSPEEMIGGSAANFVHPDDLEATRNEMRLARQGLEIRSFDTRYFTKKGKTAILAWSGVWSESDKQYYFTGHDVTESKLAEERLKYLAHYDQLTTLPNRTSLQYDLHRLMNPRAGDERRPLSIAMFDLDGFKDINDTLGHSTGDDLLKDVARRMSEFASGDARFYRLGGDEFVLTQPNCGDPREVAQVVDFMLKRLRESFDINGHQLFIGASAGIAIASEDSNVEELILNADLALYDAKAAGGNMYRLFLPALRSNALARRELDIELRRACANREFTIYFQPQLRMSDGEIVGAEALLRWQHPKRGTIGPGHFIAALAESPLALDLGRWILQTACDAAAKWRAMGLPPVRVGVNLFPVQFHEETLLKDVDTALRQSGLPPSDLELEITENIALSQDISMLAQLSVLRSKGVQLAFDDFGTGFASLSCLARYPLTRIKIDRSFVRNITADPTPQDTAIVRSLISMAHNLGLQVIAEGVETRDQAAFLRAEKCEEVQGFLYAKPLPVQDFEKLLKLNYHSRTSESVPIAVAG